MEAVWPFRSGQNANRSIACSARTFSSSGLCIGLPAGAFDLRVRLLRQLGDLAEQVDRRIGIVRLLEPLPRRLELREQLRGAVQRRSEEHTSELQSQSNLVCR